MLQELILVVSVEVNDVLDTVPVILNIIVVPPEVAVLSDGCVVGSDTMVILVKYIMRLFEKRLTLTWYSGHSH